MKDNFQQWISWLLHRWRTQRNAIRNVNCRSVTHRNFERTLHLVVFRQVCLFECLCTLSLSLSFLFFLRVFLDLSSEKESFWRRRRRKKRGFWSLCASKLTFEYLRHAFFNCKVYWPESHKSAAWIVWDGLVLYKLIHVVSLCFECWFTG